MTNIILYSTGCPRCDVLKDKLDNKAITYSINNSIDEMTNLGISEVPILCVDGQLMKFKDAVEWVNNQ